MIDNLISLIDSLLPVIGFALDSYLIDSDYLSIVEYQRSNYTIYI